MDIAVRIIGELELVEVDVGLDGAEGVLCCCVTHGDGTVGLDTKGGGIGFACLLVEGGALDGNEKERKRKRVVREECFFNIEVSSSSVCFFWDAARRRLGMLQVEAQVGTQGAPFDALQWGKGRDWRHAVVLCVDEGGMSWHDRQQKSYFWGALTLLGIMMGQQSTTRRLLGREDHTVKMRDEESTGREVGGNEERCDEGLKI